MVTWVVEDGTIVEGANTYSTTTYNITYAAARGVTITPEEIDVIKQKAMDYLETLTFQGSLVDEEQPLQHPRDYVYINAYEQTYEQLIARLAKVESELCISYKQGYDPLMTVTSAQQVISKKFDVFEKKFSEGVTETPILLKVSAMLNPLLETGGSGINFRVGRSYG